jgi:hypothetical protein
MARYLIISYHYYLLNDEIFIVSSAVIHSPHNRLSRFWRSPPKQLETSLIVGISTKSYHYGLGVA